MQPKRKTENQIRIRTRTGLIDGAKKTLLQNLGLRKTSTFDCDSKKRNTKKEPTNPRGEAVIDLWE